MPLSENDLACLIDIEECIADIEDFGRNIPFHQFENDKMRKLAVKRQLEVLGQAALGVSKEAQDDLAGIPWRQIIGLRNKLAHDYGEILTKRIWDIATQSLGPVKSEIDKIAVLRQFRHLHKEEGN